MKGRSLRAVGSLAASIVALAAVAMVAPVGPASAQPKDGGSVILHTGEIIPSDPVSRTPSQEKAYRDEFGLLVAQGVALEEISSRLDMEIVSTASAGPVAPPSVAPQSAIAAMVAQACGTVTDPGAVPTHMSVSAPIIGVNGSSQGEIWYATAKWAWTDYMANDGLGCVQDVGGRDGFGITLSKDVVNLGVSLLTCNRAGLCSNTLGSLSSNSARGAAYTFQDNVTGGDQVGFSNVDKGTLTFSFRPLTSGCIQAFSAYAHTWSSTSVTGFGVGPWSFSISWSSTTNHWDLASQAGRYGC